MKRQPFPWKIKKNSEGVIMMLTREEIERAVTTGPLSNKTHNRQGDKS